MKVEIDIYAQGTHSSKSKPKFSMVGYYAARRCPAAESSWPRCGAHRRELPPAAAPFVGAPLVP